MTIIRHPHVEFIPPMFVEFDRQTVSPSHGRDPASTSYDLTLIRVDDISQVVQCNPWPGEPACCNLILRRGPTQSMIVTVRGAYADIAARLLEAVTPALLMGLT